jgi:hypothetical protein
MIDEAGITAAKENREQRTHMGQIHIHIDTQTVFWLLLSVKFEERKATSWVFRMDCELLYCENLQLGGGGEQHFRGTCCLNLQGEICSRCNFPKRGYSSMGLHSAIIQNTTI